MTEDVFVIGEGGVQVKADTTAEEVQAEGANVVAAEAAIETAVAAAAEPDDIELAEPPEEELPTADEEIPSADDEGAEDIAGADTEQPKGKKAEEDTGWTPELLEQAKAFGFTEELAKQVGSPEEFAKHLRSRAAQEVAEGRQAREASETEGDGSRAAPQAAAPSLDVKALFAKLGAVNEDDHGPEVTGAVGAARDLILGLGQALGSMQTSLRNMKQANERAAKEADWDRVDAFVNGLDEGYAEELGKGSWRDGTFQGSPQFKARCALMESLNDMNTTRERRNELPLSIEQGLGIALILKYPKKAETRTTDKIAKAAKKRQGQRISRPSSEVATGEPYGEKRAMKAVAKLLGMEPTEEALAPHEGLIEIIEG